MQNDVYWRAVCIVSPSIYGISVNDNSPRGRIKLQMPTSAVTVPILGGYGSGLQVRLQRFIAGTERRYLLNDGVVAQTQVVQAKALRNSCLWALTAPLSNRVERFMFARFPIRPFRVRTGHANRARCSVPALTHDAVMRYTTIMCRLPLSMAGTALTILIAALAPLPLAAYGCPPPGAFEEGRINGWWVGVLLDFEGEPGSPHAATVYTTTMTQNGVLLTSIGRVQAQGDGAAELRAMFVNNKLYIVNGRYAPRSNDRQYEYFAIQRFTVQSGKLIAEGDGILNLSRLPPPPGNRSPVGDCRDSSGFDTALRKVIESGN